VDDSEQEEDIYEMYQRKINERPVYPESDASEVDYKIDKETLSPDMPRFQDYMNLKANDVHPFDKITDQVNDKLRQEGAFDQNLEDDYDKELHNRELLGRLMGRKLTPRQFDVLSGQYSAKESKLQYVRDG
jgi:hypothetical protein